MQINLSKFDIPTDGLVMVVGRRASGKTRVVQGILRSHPSSPSQRIIFTGSSRDQQLYQEILPADNVHLGYCPKKAAELTQGGVVVLDQLPLPLPQDSEALSTLNHSGSLRIMTQGFANLPNTTAAADCLIILPGAFREPDFSLIYEIAARMLHSSITCDMFREILRSMNGDSLVVQKDGTMSWLPQAPASI